MGELGLANSGGRAEQLSGFFLGSRSSTQPDPASLSEESLSAAEEAAQQVLNCVHPTLDSEEKRRDIVDYVQRLIKSHLNCEVFPYGSVPLKTYLPDGDIDLTALKGPNADESLPRDVFALLQGEEKNENAEYQVKDTQYIDAEKSFYREKSLQGRSKNKALGNYNQFHRYGRCNGLYPAFGTPSYFENGIHEVLPARSKSESRGRLDVQCQSPRSVGDGNQASGYLNRSFRIEFGSVGNLGEEVISTSAHVSGSALGASMETQCTTALMKQERVPGPSIHLKNEVDFPPLCQ
ncbi:UNVERIFIED_CONTAM: hypothetical protein Slati_0515000 [Sesamum latifolium]|uniref:Polymerase nucleotidyl transferase domain-containing protein n=1 Tax=Sesamum latifolium TaxID=2727402 RepID=A0AAW2XXR5_9LAMI